MERPEEFKNRINSIFETEEKIGVFYGGEEMESRAEFKGPSDWWYPVAWLPNKTQMGNCTNCAHFVVETLGKGDVYGFACSDNPVKSIEIESCGGHDFAVIDKRFIIDIWLSLYSNHDIQIVFDLRDKKDFAKITEYYGDPQKWSKCDNTKNFVKPNMLAKDEILVLGRSNTKTQLSISPNM